MSNVVVRKRASSSTTVPSSTPEKSTVDFQFDTLRNISTKLDEKLRRKIVTGQAPVSSVIGLSIAKNVRESLFEADGKKRKTLSSVHRAILHTLENRSEDFNVLNSGIKMTASKIEIDENKKIVTLYDSSIINGAQTQSVVNKWIKECEENDIPLSETYIGFSVLVTDSEDLVTDVAISSNFQNHIRDISIAGRQGKLDELERAVQAKFPEVNLQKSETDYSEEDTRRLIQVIIALTPEALWANLTPGEIPNKTYSYSQQSKCLNEFCRVHDEAKDVNSKNHLASKTLYQFYLDIAPQAYELYHKWKSHPGFEGTGLRAIKRTDARTIVDVPDGIIFPVLASFSAFMKKTTHGWVIDQPASYKDIDIIQKRVKPIYMGWASSNPQLMGKSKACYEHLYDIAKLYRELS